MLLNIDEFLTIWTLERAESSFQDAETILRDIVAEEAMGKEDRLDTEYEISTNLARYESFLDKFDMHLWFNLYIEKSGFV